MSNIVPFVDMQQMAKAIADSRLFGLTDVNQVLALGMVAQAEGHAFATAARDYHVIQGRPALKADAMMARFQAAGGKVNWEVYTDEKVTGTFSHPNGGSLVVTWTLDQARSIGLVKPGSGWQKFPRAMLRSRCISEGIRSVYPGSVTGFYSPEEVQDFEPVKTKDMGRVESVVLKPLHEVYKPLPDPSEMAVEEVLVTDNPLCTIPLMVPDSDTPYLHAFDVEDWILQFATLCEKIGKSKKLNGGERKEKCKALARANEGYIETFSAIQKTVLNQAIAHAGETE
jgi:hypothetical protein